VEAIQSRRETERASAPVAHSEGKESLLFHAA